MNGNFRDLSLNGGWFVDLHLSRRSMERAIEMACQAAGIQYGTDLIANLGE